MKNLWIKIQIQKEEKHLIEKIYLSYFHLLNKDKNLNKMTTLCAFVMFICNEDV